MNSEDQQPLIQVTRAEKRYGELTALKGVDLAIYPGETVGILGSNGAGKTTLIESIMGARLLDSGEINVCGYSPVSQQAECARRISIQPQGSALFKHLTVAETMELWASFYPQSRPVEEILSLVDLEAKRDSRVKTLSGGQQQRVRLGLALIGNTEIVAFDEPTVGLDPLARELIWGIIRQRAGRGAVLMATQMMDEAEHLCDRVVIMDAGQIVAEGDVTQLLDKYAGQGSVSFNTTETVDVATLENLPGVLWAATRQVGRGTSIRLVTEDPDRTGAALRMMSNVKAERLRSSGPSLGDVFFRLVGRELVAMEGEEK